MGDPQVAEGLIDPLDDLLARQAQVFQSKGDLVEHVAADDLALGVLQQGADILESWAMLIWSTGLPKTRICPCRLP